MGYWLWSFPERCQASLCSLLFGIEETLFNLFGLLAPLCDEASALICLQSKWNARTLLLASPLSAYFLVKLTRVGQLRLLVFVDDILTRDLKANVSCFIGWFWT